MTSNSLNRISLLGVVASPRQTTTSRFEGVRNGKNDYWNEIRFQSARARKISASAKCNEIKYGVCARSHKILYHRTGQCLWTFYFFASKCMHFNRHHHHLSCCCTLRAREYLSAIVEKKVKLSPWHFSMRVSKEGAALLSFDCVGGALSIQVKIQN